MYILLYISAHLVWRKKMKAVTFTDFRKKASSYFSDVENGEVLVITRHGKAIAEIIPAENNELRVPSWKKPRSRIAIKGSNISQAILEERSNS